MNEDTKIKEAGMGLHHLLFGNLIWKEKPRRRICNLVLMTQIMLLGNTVPLVLPVSWSLCWRTFLRNGSSNIHHLGCMRQHTNIRTMYQSRVSFIESSSSTYRPTYPLHWQPDVWSPQLFPVHFITVLCFLPQLRAFCLQPFLYNPGCGLHSAAASGEGSRDV